MPTKNIKGMIRISIILKIPNTFKTFMHDVEKWKNIFQKSCGLRF